MESIAETKKKRWKGQDEYDKKTLKQYNFALRRVEDVDFIDYIERRKQEGKKIREIMKEALSEVMTKK